MSKRWFMALVFLAVLVVAVYISINSAQFYMYEPGFSGSYTYNLLLNSGLSLMLGGAGLGILAGVAVALAGGRPARPAGKPGAEILLDDWGVSFCLLGGLVLAVTGIMIGGLWSPRLVSSQGAIAFTLNLHFMGIIILLFGSTLVATRMLVTGNLSQLAPLRDVFKLGKGSHYLPSYSWAGWSLVFGIVTMVIKGSFLLIGRVFNWPESVNVAVAAIHDILALVAILLALIALGFLVMERVPLASKAAPKATKAPA